MLAIASLVSIVTNWFSGMFSWRKAQTAKMEPRLDGVVLWLKPSTATLKSGEGGLVPSYDRISIYLAIGKTTDGSVGGFIRKPEFNLGVGRPVRRQHRW